jgi:hypothetical protein
MARPQSDHLQFPLNAHQVEALDSMIQELFKEQRRLTTQIAAVNGTPVTVPTVLNDLDDVNTAGVANNNVLTYNSGSGLWVPVAPASAGTTNVVPETDYATIVAPINSDFAWVNQGSSTIRDDTTAVVLTGAGTASGANIVARVKTAPAIPYTITVHLLPRMFSKAFQSYGVCFRQSSDGKLQVFDVLNSDAGLSTPLLRSTKFTSPTVFSADYTSLRVADQPRWLQISDDGTNRICRVSSDGVDWHVLHSVGRTDFLTANQIGFMISTENSATPNFAPIVRVRSWRQS